MCVELPGGLRKTLVPLRSTGHFELAFLKFLFSSRLDVPAAQFQTCFDTSVQNVCSPSLFAPSPPSASSNYYYYCCCWWLWLSWWCCCYHCSCYSRLLLLLLLLCTAASAAMTASAAYVKIQEPTAAVLF